ncbi:MAG: hypothetical protein AAGJ73_14995 [Pseudomonadota bacterium]
MSVRSKIPPYGAFVVHMAAGPQLAETVLGDLEERIAGKPNHTLWFWREFLVSSASLLRMQCRNIPGQIWAAQLLVLAMALMGASVWELAVARPASWPIARELLALSPLTAGDTCRAVYVFVYGAFAFGMMAMITRLAARYRRSVHFQNWQVVAVAVVASTPAIYLIAFPLPADGALWFRIAQLLLIWLIAFAQISSTRLTMRPAT